MWCYLAYGVNCCTPKLTSFCLQPSYSSIKESSAEGGLLMVYDSVVFQRSYDYVDRIEGEVQGYCTYFRISYEIVIPK